MPGWSSELQVYDVSYSHKKQEQGNGSAGLVKINTGMEQRERRYYADEATLDTLEKNHRVLFHYCDAEGKAVPEANVNGSARNIAGICNEGRNVFGMMPHPERACSAAMGNTDGRKIFELLFSPVLEMV